MSHLVAEAKHNRKLENIIPAIVVFLPMALNHLYSEQRQQILGVLLELLSSFPCTSHILERFKTRMLLKFWHEFMFILVLENMKLH